MFFAEPTSGAVTRDSPAVTGSFPSCQFGMQLASSNTTRTICGTTPHRNENNGIDLCKLIKIASAGTHLAIRTVAPVGFILSDRGIEIAHKGAGAEKRV